MKRFLVLAALVLISTTATAQEILVEDFESFDDGDTPSRAWYSFRDFDSQAEVNSTGNVIEGTKSLFLTGDTSSTVSGQVADFRLNVPTQLDNTTFFINATTITDNGVGSQQVVSLSSVSPIRDVVEFFVFCIDTANPDGCELRVRFDHIDSTGQVLINTSLDQSQFKINMVFNWLTSEYQLAVDDVNDGTFPFLELPRNIGRLRFSQYRQEVPMELSFDNWTLGGAINQSAAAVGGDVSNGIKQFANDIRFTSSGSLFFLGLLIFIVIMAAVIVPLLALGRDNTVIPATAFFAIIVTLWLIDMEFWPSWIGIALIIVAAVLISFLVRQATLGIKDASSGAGLIAGSLGYFIIASSFLAFSGYATDTIVLPTNPNAQANDDGGNVTGTQQTFIGAVTECIFSGGVFTFGLVGDCSQDTVTTTWASIVDTVGNIYGWVQASVDYVFQLLAFRLPIPVLFNVMIVAPPAAALAAYAVGVIRGNAS